MKYQTIAADPPWDYSGGFVTYRGPRSDQQVRDKVPTQAERRDFLEFASMTVEEIAALRVPVDTDAHLFLWTTNRYLRDGFDVMEAWGFTYAQTIVWVKDARSPFVASVAPNHAEYLLVGRRGNLPWTGSLRSNVVEAGGNPSWRRHSAKPDVFLDLIEQVSPGPYLELFARRQRLGWDTWGNEALEHVELSA